MELFHAPACGHRSQMESTVALRAGDEANQMPIAAKQEDWDGEARRITLPLGRGLTQMLGVEARTRP